MSEFLSFLQNPTSNSVIIMMALLVALPQIPAIIKLVNAYRQTDIPVESEEEEKYPLIKEYLSAMAELNGTNERLLENHFKHEIPEMMADLKEIKSMMYEMKDIHGNRLTRLETLIDTRNAKL